MMPMKRITLISMILSLILSLGKASAIKTLYVDPSSVTSTDEFTIDIEVSDVTNLYGYEFKLGYDTSILDATEVMIGSFLNEPTYPVVQEINDADGYVSVGVLSLNPADPKSGSGTLANITFQVTGSDSCALDLYDSVLGDYDVNPIDHTVNDGYFSNLPSVWQISYIGSGGHPIIDVFEYNDNLYEISHNKFYVYDGANWIVVDLPKSMPTITDYEGKIYVGFAGGWDYSGDIPVQRPTPIYTYDGTNWNHATDLEGGTYARMLGVHDNTIYATTLYQVTGGCPDLYYCDGSCETSGNWNIDTSFKDFYSTHSGAVTWMANIERMESSNGWFCLTDGNKIFCKKSNGWEVVSRDSDLFYYGPVESSISSRSGIVEYNGKYYKYTKDSPHRCPVYQGHSGYCSRVWEWDGVNWNVIFDYMEAHITSMTVYSGKLFVGTAGKIYEYDGTNLEVSVSSEGEEVPAVSISGIPCQTLKTYKGSLFCGWGNGYIFEYGPPQEEGLVVETFYPNFDGHIAYHDGEYDSVDTDSEYIRVGEYYNVWHYRGFLRFDISSIPNDATIEKAILELPGLYSYYQWGDFGAGNIMLSEIQDFGFSLDSTDWNKPVIRDYGALISFTQLQSRPPHRIDVILRLKKDVKNSISPTGTSISFRIKDSVENYDNEGVSMDIPSSERTAIESWQGPRLEVTYKVPRTAPLGIMDSLLQFFRNFFGRFLLVMR
jgi:hypothetical protein